MRFSLSALIWIAIQISCTTVLSTNSSIGGSIYWDCKNGKYIFFLKKYTECSGSTWNFQPTNLSIIGNPLPKDSNNANITSITLYPDSTKWQSLNTGFTDPLCNRGTAIYNCSNPFSIQQFLYRSDPVELNGVPPSNGWSFYYIGNQRPSFDNVSAGTFVLNSIMYSDSLGSNVSSCLDNSPKFAEIPTYIHCKFDFNNFTEAAIDIDGDSLTYELGEPYSALFGTSPTPITYYSGYSYQVPLPPSSFNPNNFGLRYDNKTGEVTFQIVSGSNAVRSFLVKYAVHSYRNGSRIATVFHEKPIIIDVCPSLPNQTNNWPPEIDPPFNKGGGIFSFEDTVIVGNLKSISLSVRDTNSFNGSIQNMRITLKGQGLSANYTTNNNCPSPWDTACAVVNSNPQLDINRSEYYYAGTSVWSGTINWQTDCSDLNPDGSAKTHYFYITALDDQCPIPGLNSKAIVITVLPDTSVCSSIITNTMKSLSHEVRNSTSWVEEVAVFPNPSNGIVFIECVLGKSYTYQLFDLNGKLIKNGQFSSDQKELQMPEQSGLYFLKLMSLDGNIEHFKLLKN